MIVSRPTGSGKTSLLRTWADRSTLTQRAAFVAVAHDQHDEQLFWLTLLQAIRCTLGRSHEEEPLSATPRLHAEPMVDRVLSELDEMRVTWCR